MTPAALAELHARAMVFAPAWSEDAFARSLAAPGVFLCGGAAGFALGRAAGGEAELLTVAVAPEQRRRGLGRQLLAAFEARAGVLGARQGFLEVASDNRAALALYRGAGWSDRGLRPGYYPRDRGPAADALVLGKRFA